MQDKRLVGMLVSFFNDGSVFQEILQRKRNIESIQNLEDFIYDLQANRCNNRKRLRDISKTINNVVKINQHNNFGTPGALLEYSNAIDAVFRFILNLPCFVTWINDIGDYFMSIPVTATTTSDFIRTSALLRNQLSCDLLKNHPTPALVVRLIRQGFANVFPSLEMDVYANTNGQQMDRRKYSLQTVICLNSRNELTAYIRQKHYTSEATWRLIKVKEWNSFTKSDLSDFEKQLNFVNNLPKLDSVHDGFIDEHSVYIMKRCIFLVYVPPQMKEEVTRAACNSLMDMSEPTYRTTPDIAINREWKGIHGDENSCFMDSLLMSWLFHPKCQTAFFRILESSSCRSKCSQQAVQIADVRSLVGIIGTITLRLNADPPYCEKSVVWELRKVLSKYNPNVCGEMLDVTEFINVLFGSSLGADHFITYRPLREVPRTGATKEIGSFLHQIIIGPVVKLEPVDVATLLERSMKIQGIKFKVHPEPFLIIKLPVNNGKLVGVEYVIPSLELRICDTAEERSVEFKYQLMAIVCLHDMHYTAFIRKREKDWIYFDSMSPKLTGPEAEFLEDFTQDLMEGPVSWERKQKVEKVLHKSCLYIYLPIPTSELIFAEQQAEHENKRNQPTNLLNGPMEIKHDEFVNSSASINADVIATFIRGHEPSSQQDPRLSSDLINLNCNITAEKGRINNPSANISAELFEIFEFLLYLIQSNHAKLFGIFRGIKEKLKTKATAEGYMPPGEIQASFLVEYIDWNTGTASTSNSPFGSVWNKLVEFAEGATSENACVELHVKGPAWVTVGDLYKYHGRKETSPHGLVISLQRNSFVPIPVLIENTITTLASKPEQSLNLFCVICSIKDEGLITYIFNPEMDCWTKKRPNGKVQVLHRLDSCFLGFFTEGTDSLSDNKILESYSIGVIYIVNNGGQTY